MQTSTPVPQDDAMQTSPEARLLSSLYHLRELGDEATWTLSSAKSGNGAEQLRDGNQQTFWQSDGTHPHTILVQFHRRVAVSELGLYLDYKLDESYTPKKIRVSAGTTRFDLTPVTEVEFHEPTGWVPIPLLDARQRPLTTFCLQIAMVAMHQNGRDTHVRLVRIFGPRRHEDGGAARPMTSANEDALSILPGPWATVR
jgi:anaphase-promoting complex subunit 10